MLKKLAQLTVNGIIILSVAFLVLIIMVALIGSNLGKSSKSVSSATGGGKAVLSLIVSSGHSTQDIVNIVKGTKTAKACTQALNNAGFSNLVCKIQPDSNCLKLDAQIDTYIKSPSGNYIKYNGHFVKKSSKPSLDDDGSCGSCLGPGGDSVGITRTTTEKCPSTLPSECTRFSCTNTNLGSLYTCVRASSYTKSFYYLFSDSYIPDNWISNSLSGLGPSQFKSSYVYSSDSISMRYDKDNHVCGYCAQLGPNAGGYIYNSMFITHTIRPVPTYTCSNSFPSNCRTYTLKKQYRYICQS